MDLVQEPALAPAQEPQVSDHAAILLYHLLLLLPNCCAALQRSSMLSKVSFACCCQVCFPFVMLHALILWRRFTIAVLSIESAFT